MRNYLIVACLVGAAFAQEKLTPIKSESPKPVVMSQAMQNKLLKAEHEYDVIIAGEQQIQLQASSLQTNFNALEAKKDPAAKAVNVALDEAWKESGLSKDDYTLDPASFTFAKKDKATSAAVAPASPGK